MDRRIGMSAYVRRRNGVPLGHRASMGNMLRRAFGAGSLGGFWRYWNPIWGYGLGRYIFAPLSKWLPQSAALLLTFAASGLIHDAVIMLLRQAPALVFTPWFSFVGTGILLGERFSLRFGTQPFAVRGGIHAIFLAATFSLAYLASSKVGLW